MKYYPKHTKYLLVQRHYHPTTKTSPITRTFLSLPHYKYKDISPMPQPPSHPSQGHFSPHHKDISPPPPSQGHFSPPSQGHFSHTPPSQGYISPTPQPPMNHHKDISLIPAPLMRVVLHTLYEENITPLWCRYIFTM